MHATDERLERFRASARDRKRRQRQADRYAEIELPLLEPTDHWGWVERKLMALDAERKRTQQRWRW